MSNHIPAYIIEEHHEAFYYWGLAVEKGYLKPHGNVLFHIDHHDDLEGGGYFCDFARPIESLEERKEITYRYLGIADFIVPALYEGLFDSLYCMKSTIPRPFVPKDRLVRRVGRHILTFGDYVPFLHAGYKKEGREDYRFFTHYEGSLMETGELSSVALDIDLDYFCWDNALRTVGEKRMEITRQAYEEYQGDVYHPFRILPRRLLSVQEEHGRYYLCYQEPPVWEKPANEERIRKRMRTFLGWLGGQAWKPSVITLCRSAYSGYTPTDKADLIEGLLLEGMGGLW